MVMAVTREHELWAMALWVDREYGEESERFITKRVLYLDAEGDDGGKQLWMDVARRFVELRATMTTEPN